MQWSPEIVALGIHIRAMFKQKLHRVDSHFVVLIYCFVQRGLFSRVPNINSPTELEQELGHLEMISAQRCD